MKGEKREFDIRIEFLKIGGAYNINVGGDVQRG